jgi:hypothetical protein
MAVDKLVDSNQLDANLTSVANAIRAKGGTSAQMALPTGFVSAVQAIPTGTTPTGTKQISINQNGTTIEDVAAYANAEITVNVQGGGLQLLGSGTYTYSGSAAANIVFPVSYTGTPKILLCLKDSQDEGVGETLGCYKVLATGISTIDDAFTKGACAYLVKGANDAVGYQGVAPGDTQCIYLCNSDGPYPAYDPTGSYMRLVRFNNSNLLQPGSYSYYIYG